MKDQENSTDRLGYQSRQSHSSTERSARSVPDRGSKPLNCALRISRKCRWPSGPCRKICRCSSISAFLTVALRPVQNVTPDCHPDNPRRIRGDKDANQSTQLESPAPEITSTIRWRASRGICSSAKPCWVMA